MDVYSEDSYFPSLNDERFGNFMKRRLVGFCRSSNVKTEEEILDAVGDYGFSFERTMGQEVLDRLQTCGVRLDDDTTLRFNPVKRHYEDGLRRYVITRLKIKSLIPTLPLSL